MFCGIWIGFILIAELNLQSFMQADPFADPFSDR